MDRSAEQERGRWPASSVPLKATIRSIGDRPAGTVPDSALIIRSAVESARQLGVRVEFGSWSTDANIPMSLGIPAVAIGGGGSAGGAPSPAEWYTDGPEGWKGPQWLLLLATHLANIRPAAHPDP